MSLKTNVSVVEDVLIVSLEGKVLEDALLKTLLADIDKQLPTVKGKIVIDLQKLDYINSVGINFFIKTLTKARVNNGDLILNGAQGSVLNIVRISKMNEVFTMTETIEEAMERFKK